MSNGQRAGTTLPPRPAQTSGQTSGQTSNGQRAGTKLPPHTQVNWQKVKVKGQRSKRPVVWYNTGAPDPATQPRVRAETLRDQSTHTHP
eukprot:1954723-Rhodomonas_salina.1